ncbi:hypothetical protein OIO90_004493 [Microbotryomycetes sp. JL221]|nr:hypothetical protein OIO90_004493 [Microbotryomycetes sp. JL221]
MPTTPGDGPTPTQDGNIFGEMETHLKEIKSHQDDEKAKNNNDFIEGGNVIEDPKETRQEATDAKSPYPTPSATGTNDAGSALASAVLKKTKTEPPGAGGTEAMKPLSNSDYTVIVHTDPAIEYNCPTQEGNWTHNNVLPGTSITGSITSGPGCYVRFTFTGDSVTMYGGTGPKFGVFQCHTSTEVWDATGAWNAFGQTNFFKAYQGSCTIAGLGYDKHTITLTNSPRATTTLSKGGSKPTTPGSTEGNTGIGEFNWKTVTAIVLGLIVLIALAALLIGAMCCTKKREKERDPFEALTENPGFIGRRHRSFRGIRRRKKSKRPKKSRKSDKSDDPDTDTGSSDDSSRTSDSTTKR